MRKAIFSSSVIGAMASAGLLAVAAQPGHHMGPARYSAGQRPRRSWYVPHQGPREIARRLRQEERNRDNQIIRADGNFAYQIMGAARVSRRGRILETAEQAREAGA